jgi:hypothetical protein
VTGPKTRQYSDGMHAAPASAVAGALIRALETLDARATCDERPGNKSVDETEISTA